MGMCESREEIKDGQFGRSTIQPKMSESPNIDFYKGIYPFSLNNQIHFHVKHWRTYTQNYQWIKFYSDLESDKQFMQWLYPNFFQSFLNTTSFRLTTKERNIFIENDMITKQYLENAEMFLRFLGIERNQDKEFQVIDESQFNQCLYTYTHNQVRILRFLSSLSILGQRDLALEVLALLKKQLGKNNKIYQTKFQGFELLVEELDLSAQSIDTKKKPTKSFSEYKNHYVQEDLLNEDWVQASILTKSAIVVVESVRASYEVKI